MFNLLLFSFDTSMFKGLIGPKLLSEVCGHYPLFYFLLVRLQGLVNFYNIFSQRTFFSSVFVISMYNLTLDLQFKIFRFMCLSISSL